MATDNEARDESTEGTETDPQNQATGQSPAGETPQDETQGQTQTPDPGESQGDKQDEGKDPAKESLLRDLRAERDKRQALAAEVQSLKDQLSSAGSATQELTALQTKFSRLEAFVSQAAGPLGKVLDSKSFSARLFESDDDIESIVKDWFQANPTATSSALSGGGPGGGSGKPDMNELLRIAAK